MRCGHCERTFLGSDRASCPFCGQDPDGAPAAVATAELDADERECPACAETIKTRASVCRFCRTPFDERGRPRRRPAAGRERVVHHYHTEAKSPGIALLLAFLLSGLGHLYCGLIARGLLFLCMPLAIAVTYVAGLFLFFAGGDPVGAGGWVIFMILLGTGLHFYQMFDAYQSAVQVNARAARRGRPRRRARVGRR